MNIASAACLQWQGDSAMARFIRVGKEDVTDVKLTGCPRYTEGGQVDRPTAGDRGGERQLTGS